MEIRPLEPLDIPAARELQQYLGYDISIGELSQRADRVQSTAGHYVAVAEKAGHVVGLVHAFERPALEKPYERAFAKNKKRPRRIARSLDVSRNF